MKLINNCFYSVYFESFTRNIKTTLFQFKFLTLQLFNRNQRSFSFEAVRDTRPWSFCCRQVRGSRPTSWRKLAWLRRKYRSCTPTPLRASKTWESTGKLKGEFFLNKKNVLLLFCDKFYPWYFMKCYFVL